MGKLHLIQIMKCPRMAYSAIILLMCLCTPAKAIDEMRIELPNSEMGGDYWYFKDNSGEFHQNKSKKRHYTIANGITTKPPYQKIGMLISMAPDNSDAKLMA